MTDLCNLPSLNHPSGKGIIEKNSYLSYLFVYLEHYSCEYGSVKYYIYCAISGMLSCGITHTAVVPLVCWTSVCVRFYILRDEFFWIGSY